MPVSDVDPNLIHLFLQERIYVLPEDRAAAIAATAEPLSILVETVTASPAQPTTKVETLLASPVLTSVPMPSAAAPIAPPDTSTLPAPTAPVAPTPTADPYSLPKLPSKALAILVHNPEGELAPALATMLGKLATATEPNAAQHVLLVGDMSRYPWPAAWHPWPARLTLLLGWPADLLARNRIAQPFRVLRFASAALIAAPHPTELEADRALKSQLWGLIQTVRA